MNNTHLIIHMNLCTFFPHYTFNIIHKNFDHFRGLHKYLKIKQKICMYIFKTNVSSYKKVDFSFSF